MADTYPTDPTPDERILAAAAHASILIPMMGFFAPLIIWILQKDKSRFVAFQSLQALAYQFALLVGYMLGMLCYGVSFFLPFLFMIPLSGQHTSSQVDSILGLGFLLPFVMLLIVGLAALAAIVYGIVAAVNAFQGRPFRYWIVGAQVERFTRPQPAAA